MSTYGIRPERSTLPARHRRRPTRSCATDRRPTSRLRPSTSEFVRRCRTGRWLTPLGTARGTCAAIDGVCLGTSDAVAGERFDRFGGRTRRDTVTVLVSTPTTHRPLSTSPSRPRARLVDDDACRRRACAATQRGRRDPDRAGELWFVIFSNRASDIAANARNAARRTASRHPSHGAVRGVAMISPRRRSVARRHRARGCDAGRCRRGSANIFRCSTVMVNVIHLRSRRTQPGQDVAALPRRLRAALPADRWRLRAPASGTPWTTNLARLARRRTPAVREPSTDRHPSSRPCTRARVSVITVISADRHLLPATARLLVEAGLGRRTTTTDPEMPSAN